jgi:uncharacterized DUF497 family protein
MRIDYDPLKRGDIRRIISMRKANDRERARYGQDLRDLAGG